MQSTYNINANVCTIHTISRHKYVQNYKISRPMYVQHIQHLGLRMYNTHSIYAYVQCTTHTISSLCVYNTYNIYLFIYLFQQAMLQQ